MSPLDERLALELFVAPAFLSAFLSGGVGLSDDSVISDGAGIVLFLAGRCKRIAVVIGGVQASMIFLRMA